MKNTKQKSALLRERIFVLPVGYEKDVFGGFVWEFEFSPNHGVSPVNV